MSRRKQTKPRPYVLDEESPAAAVAAAAGADLLLTDGRVLTEAPGGGCGQPAGGHPDHDDVMSAGCGDTASSPESARSSRRSPPAAPAAHTNGYGSSEDDNNTAQTDDHVVVSADSKVLEFSEEGCTEDVSTMDSELLKGTDELVSKDDICDQDGDKDSGDKFSVKGHVNNEGDDEDADLQEDLEYGDDDDDDDEDGMDEDEIVAAVQNGLLPNSNVMLQTLATTRVAVAQIAENNMALALEGSPGLQQTLLSLQQQQFLQLQLLHQLQHQLYRFMGAADEGGAHHAMFPPPLLPHPNMMATAEDSIDNTDSQQLPENGSSPPYIRASPPLCSSGEKKDSLVPESSDSLANLAKLANGPDPSDMLGGKSMNRNSSTSSLNKVGGKSPCGTGSGAPSVGTMLERSQYAADDPFYRHKCRFCHKVFGSDSALQIHVRSHTGEKPYKCNVCGSRFSTKGNYKVHFERHKSEFPHVEMDDRLYLDEKPQIPGPPELYKDSMALLPPPAPRPPTAPRTPPPPPPQQHGIQNLFKHHFGEEKSPKPEGSQHMPAELPNPNKFLHHGGPLGHMMVTHSTAITSISSRSPTPGVMHTSHPPLPPNMMGLPPFPDFPMFRAPSVSKQEEDDMEQFMEVEQSETGKLEALVKGIEDKLSDPNQCIICKRILSCKSSLQMHYRTHTGERPFKCKICSRAFTTKGNLKTHMGVHRSKPPLRMMHQCPVCHKQFTNGLVLQQHMRIHGGEGLKAFLPPPPMLPPMGSMGLPFPFPGLPFPMPPHMGMPPNFHINGMDLSKHPGSIDTNDDDEFDENEYDDDTGDFDENEDESMDTSDRKIRSDEETHHQKENANKYDDDQRNTSGSGGVEKVPSSTPVPYSPMKSPVNSANIPISSTFMNNQPSVITSTPAFSTSLSALENSVKAIDSFMAPKYPGFPFPEPMPHTDSRSSSVVQSESGALHDRCTPKDTNMPGNRPMDSPALSETNSSVSSLNRTHDNSNREKGSPMSSPPTSFPMNPFMHIGFNPYDSQGSVHNNHNNTCRLCLKTFSCKAELEMHERSHDSDRPYFCQVCDRSFSTESNMRQHMLTHKIKDLPSEYEKNLPSGFDKDQNSGASSPVSEAESKDASSSLSTITPPCISSTLPPMSKYSTSTTTNLSPSSSVVTSSRLPSPALPSPRLPTSSGTSPLPPMFKSIPPTIPTASSSLSSSSDNSPFVRRHNPKHTCQVCQKPFSGGSALQIHMRTHTGEKPFKCEVCGKAFTTKGNLKVHMGTHMVQNGPSRRGRRMSMEGLPGFPPGPVGPKDPMPERPGGGGFNPFTPRNADMYPGFPFTVFPNGLFPPMKGMPPFPLPPTSGGPLMKGPPVSLPHDLLMKPPHPAAGLSQEMLMKAEEMLKNQQRNSGLDGLKRDMFDNNNLPGVPTSKGTSGELDLRLRKPSPAIST